jgi:hypothetical protein
MALPAVNRHNTDALEVEQICPDRAARAARVLAVLMGSPSPLTEDESREAFDSLREIMRDPLDQLFSGPEEFRACWNEKSSSFTGPVPIIRMEESVYKPWTEEPAHPLAGTTGLAWGDPAAHMLTLLNRAGLAYDAEPDLAPDHPAVILEFLAFLLEHRPVEEAASFCADHLDWLGDLETEADELPDGKVLKTLIRASQDLVRSIVD